MLKRFIENYRIHRFVAEMQKKMSEDELYDAASKYGKIYNSLTTAQKKRFLKEMTKVVQNVR